MTRFLASVRSAEEADTVLAAGADIVDLKDPANGALGAVAPQIARSCAAGIAGRVPVSATVGDLPMDPGVVTKAVAGMAACGVDDVKLGLMPGGAPDACFADLRRLGLHCGLILVFFADAMPKFDPFEAALAAGARGLMLDTARKEQGALPDHMSLSSIARFVAAGRAAGLLVGVAGALRARHVADLLTLEPDVLGFRGALCRGGRRGQALDPLACRQIRALIPGKSHHAEGRFREAAAGALW